MGDQASETVAFLVGGSQIFCSTTCVNRMFGRRSVSPITRDTLSESLDKGERSRPVVCQADGCGKVIAE